MRFRRIAIAFAAVPALLAACDYQMKGRVVQDSFDSLQLVAADDPRLEEGTPVKGARVIVTRDPGSLKRADVASAVSDGSGWFTIRLGETGAGFTDESWGIRVMRTGFGGTEEMVELPFDPSKSRLLVTLTQGPARRGSERSGGAGADVNADIDRFGSSSTGRTP